MTLALGQRARRAVEPLCTLVALAALLAACGSSMARCGRAEPPQAALVAVDERLARALTDVPFRARKAARSLSDAAPLASGELLVVSDEGTELGLALPGGKGRAIDVLEAFPEFRDALGGALPKEIDLEGAAADGARIVVTGSASLKREKPEPGGDPAAQLREVKLASGEGKPHSNYLLELAPARSASSGFALVRTLDVRRLLLADPLLETFADVPSKENGLDVEGVALRGDTAYLGLRGPVLRGHAVVAEVDLARGSAALRFLGLDGLGIRSLCAAEGGGLWVLGGPTLDVAEPFALYHWDGLHSAVQGDTGGALRRVMPVAHGPGEKPEGLFERDGALCVLHDGAEGGAPRCTPLSALR